ncbi:hypothetical protein DMN91_009722 [Ooceraea biroi]|uniref:Uncharacterized protein n=1 Tax=Ooceraea biroi TaxID=2015173 RepID=A0A3L8DAI3_OOCBI|nr:hypothetical protein DMN91_009722 [Ooceraea biroi]
MAGWNTHISISSTMVRPCKYLSKHNRFSNSPSKLVIPATRVCYVKESPPTIMEPQEVNRTCLIQGFPHTIDLTCEMQPTININRNTEVWMEDSKRDADFVALERSSKKIFRRALKDIVQLIWMSVNGVDIIQGSYHERE